MDTLSHDLRYAVRQLLRTPGFTIVALLSLGLGIGINTTIFSMVSALLLQPLPVAEPARVVGVFTSDFSGPAFGGSSFADFTDLHDRARSYEALAATMFVSASLGGSGEPAVATAEVASGDYFRVVGRPPLRGRYFAPDESRAGGGVNVAVISAGLWHQRFGGDESVVGRTVTIAGRPFTVIGVGPEGFGGLTRGVAADLWVPLPAYRQLQPGDDFLESRGNRGLFVVGLLKPRVSQRAAQAEADVLAAQLHQAYPGEWTDIRSEPRRLTLVPERDLRFSPQLRGTALGAAALMLTLAGAVLLIACANLSNLMLTRAAARRKEIAIRLSLGSGRGRLVRQLLTESVLLAGAGGLVGVLAALWSTDLLSALPAPPPLPALHYTVDSRVLAFAVLVSVVTGALLGLAPALQASRPDVVAALRDDAAGPRRSRLRSAFVVAQVAMSLVLLVAGGLFVRSLRNATAIDPGFRTRSALLLSLNLDLNGYPADRVPGFFRELVDNVRAIPGVEAAAVTTIVPLGGGRTRRSLRIVGYTPRPGEEMELPLATVGAGYFEAMGVPVLRGRGFLASDREGAPGVVVVNEAFAARFWPGANPVGRQVLLDGEGGPVSTVVGLVANGKYVSLGEAPTPFYYTAFEQHPRSGGVVIVRTAGDPRAVIGPVRAAVAAMDRNLPIAGITTLQEQLDLSTLPARAAGILLGAFGLLGLILAAVGLYGVMAYSVQQRTHEIGIRMALGARASDVLQLVVGRGLSLTLVGLGLGLALALPLSRLVAGFLYGLSPNDPVTLAAVVALLGAVALGAAYLPARRAAHISPSDALRIE